MDFIATINKAIGLGCESSPGQGRTKNNKIKAYPRKSENRCASLILVTFF